MIKQGKAIGFLGVMVYALYGSLLLAQVPDTLLTQTCGGADSDTGYSMQQSTDNDYVTVGHTSSFGTGYRNVWPLRIEVVGIEETTGDVIPVFYALSQNYPNPFKTETAIHYQLPQPNVVTIAIYNVSGQRVKTLVNEHGEAGYYIVPRDGRSQDSQRVSNGVCFCQMVACECTSTKKILLMR